MKLGLPLYLQIILIGAGLYALVVILVSLATDYLPSDSYWVIAAYVCLTVVNLVIFWKRDQQRRQKSTQ